MKRALLIGFILMATSVYIISCCTTEYVLHTERYVVGPGDTVWKIACLYLPHQQKARSVDEFIYEIEVANNWRRVPVIYSGDVIKVPLYLEKKNGN